MIRKLIPTPAGLTGVVVTSIFLGVSNSEAPRDAVSTHTEIRIIR